MKVWTTHGGKLALVLTATAALVAIGVTSSAAPPATPRVYPPQSMPYGQSYAEWSAAWWQWAFSLPVTEHPLLEGDACEFGANGQAGPVWFLGGSFVSATVTRECTVPAGRAIFFPIINAECSTLEPEPFACSDEASCSGCAAGFVDATAGLACEIDGVPVTDLESYRVQSPLFTIGPLTEDNLLGLPEGTTGESVSDGVWVMVAPLSVGEHTIHFAGTFVDFDLTLDVTYHLTIVP